MKISPKKKKESITVGGVDLKQIGGQNRDANANDDAELNKQQRHQPQRQLNEILNAPVEAAGQH